MSALSSAPTASIPKAPSPAPPLRGWVLFVLLLAAACPVYLPALLQAQYLNFDDNLFFGPDNQAFAEGGLARVLDPHQTIANVYLPVAHLSLYLDWQLFGSAPLVPHLESLLLHVLAAFVLVRWLWDLGVSRLAGLGVGAVFLLHPALTESVAWVSSRKDLLSGLFTFLCLRVVTANARAPSAGKLAGIAGLGVLALYSKATAVVLPVLAALTCWYLRGTSRARWWSVAVLFAVALPIAWHHRLLAVQEGTLVGADAVARLSQVPGAFLHYLETALWPSGLNVLYPEVDTMAAFRRALWPGLLILFGLLALLVWLVRSPRGRTAALGLGILLVGLAPFNTAFPASNVAAADRYLYLALPGAALALATVFRGAGAVALIAAVPLAVIAGHRAHAFTDSESLWRDSLAEAPHNAVAQLNLAYELQSRSPQEVAEPRELLERAAGDARYPVHELRARQGLLRIAMLEARYEAAALHAERAVAAAERLPATPSAQTIRLQAMLQAFQPLTLAGRREDARALFRRARAMASDDPTVAAFQAILWLDEARQDDGTASSEHPLTARAAALLDEVLAAHPDHYEVNVAKARWEAALGNQLTALRHLRIGQKALPAAGEAWLVAATICQNQGMYAEAERYARGGLAVRRDDPALRQALAMALAGQMRFDDAIDHMEAYVANRPRDRAAARILAHLLGSKARAAMNQLPAEDLERLVQRARELDPEETKGDVVLGKIARERRDWLRALHHLERASEAFPDDPEVRAMLADTLFDRGYHLKLKEDNPDAAFDCWRRYLDIAPPGAPTEAIETYLENEWKRLERKGIEELRAGDLQVAEKAFRRCLELRPDLHWAAWLLGQVLFHGDGESLEEAEALFARAAAGQREHGLDSGKQVLWRIVTLQKLGRDAEAEQAGRRYLAEPPETSDPAVLEEIRRILGG